MSSQYSRRRTDATARTSKGGQWVDRAINHTAVRCRQVRVPYGEAHVGWAVDTWRGRGGGKRYARQALRRPDDTSIEGPRAQRASEVLDCSPQRWRCFQPRLATCWSAGRRSTRFRRPGSTFRIGRSFRLPYGFKRNCTKTKLLSRGASKTNSSGIGCVWLRGTPQRSKATQSMFKLGRRISRRRPRSPALALGPLAPTVWVTHALRFALVACRLARAAVPSRELAAGLEQAMFRERFQDL